MPGGSSADRVRAVPCRGRGFESLWGALRARVVGRRQAYASRMLDEPLVRARALGRFFPLLALHSTIALAVFRVFAIVLIRWAYSSRRAVCAEQDGGGNLFRA